MEAEREEKKDINWKNRKIRQRLIDFRTSLINDGYMQKTVQQYMQRIKTLYRTYEIEIRELPYLSNKTIPKAPPITYKDLPTRDLLRNILPLCNQVQSALMLFMISSGCARKEALSLKIQDFIDATSEYHDGSDDINIVLGRLYGREDVIPTWSVFRFKTGQYYTTFSSPESTVFIVGYLLSRRDLLESGKSLFKINEHYVSDFFSLINKRLGLGKAGTYNKFRSHALRKFHASALYNDGMSKDMVNELQGKMKSKTDRAYFVVNPDVLRREYIHHIGSVSILSDVDVGVWGKLDLSDLDDFSRFY
jgi:integrase